MKTRGSKAKIGVGHHSRSVIFSESDQKLEVLRPDAAGIDCGAQEHYIAVPPDRVRTGEPTVRCFSAFTEGLDAAVDWLKACRISTAAMESTGVYWIPLHQKLEAAGIEVYLVNARHVSECPGTQDRRTRQPMAASTAPLRAFECLLPSPRHHLPAAESASASG